MRDLGYIEGQNLILERRSAEGHFERYRDIIAELVQLKMDVIVAVTTRMAQEAKAVTTTVPIVVASSNSDLGKLVHTLSKPGGTSLDSCSCSIPNLRPNVFNC
jgi:putative tryptophan/tyrosine transport system substrate-binding protein